MSHPAPPETEPTPAVESLSPEEMQQRTVRGISLWLRVVVTLFWVTLVFFVCGNLMRSSPFTKFGQFGLLASLGLTPLTYLFALLEPAAYADRVIKRLLAVSFGSFVLLSLLFVLAQVLDVRAFSLLAGLRILLLAGAVVLLIHALRANNRLLFAAALVIMLVANIIPL